MIEEQKKLYELEAKIESLKTQKSELQSAMKLTQEEVSRRTKMGMDAKDFEEHLKGLDKKLVKVLKDLPKAETDFYNLRRNMDAENKKKMLQEYIETRIRYYSNALDKLKGKKGAKLSMMFPNKTHENQIGQLARGE